jgi:putative hemolysin
MNEPVRVISTVQVGITSLGIVLGAVGEPALSSVFEPALAAGIALALSLVIVTFLSVWLGELVPKALALHSAERVALLVARPIDVLSRLFRPVVWVLEKAAALVLRPLGIPSVSAGDRALTRDELRSVVEEAAGEDGELGPEEERMLTGLIELTGREVREVLVPWDDVVTVPAGASLEAASAIVLAAPHTRYPALDEEGQVVGVLHLRELWRASATGEAGTVAGLLREPIVVPPPTQLRDLLTSMRRTGEHLAVVINEYGQMVGVATMEDILEEVVGEIEDEYDRPRRVVRALGPGVWAVDAGISIDEFNRRAGFDLPDERDHTVGGLVFSELGRAPHPGDEVTVDGVALRVEAVDGHRIERVIATER